MCCCFSNLVNSYLVPCGRGIRFASISLPSGFVQSNKKIIIIKEKYKAKIQRLGATKLICCLS